MKEYIKAAIFIILVLPLYCWGAFICQKLYKWFIEPSSHIPLPFTVFFGAVCIFYFLRTKIYSRKETKSRQNRGYSDVLILSYSQWAASGLVILIVAQLYKLLF